MMQDAVSLAPATLDGVLHKSTLPLGVVNGLALGSVIPIDGATVGSVRLFALGGHLVATTRLRQAAGMRAVRLDPAQQPAMRDIPAPNAAVIANVD